MTWLTDKWFLFLLLGLYIVLLAHHALVGRRKSQTLTDFLVGGRKMGGLAIGLSFFATYSSTNSFVGFSGQSYLYGLPWLLLTPFLVISSLCAWLWIAPRLRDFTAALGSLTIPDFLGFRFQSRAVRVQAAIIVIFAGLFYMTAVFKGIANLLEAFLNVPYWLAIVIVFTIVMLYTAVGGFISVVKTDVVQGLLMIVGAIILFWGTVSSSGGIGALWDVRQLPGGENLFSWDAAMPFPLLLGILFAATIKFVAEPRQLSRFYALKDRSAVRTGLWVSTLSVLLVYFLLTPIGLYARNLITSEVKDSDLIVPTILTDPAVFHPFLGAFLLLVMVAAAMSSLDSVLLVTASTGQRDLFGLLFSSSTDRSELRQTSILVILFALLTAIIALSPPGGIVSLTVFSGSLYAACFIPALVFGLYWKRGSMASVTASFVSGLVCLLLWNSISPWPWLHRVFPSLLVSILTFLVVAVITSPTHPPDMPKLFVSASKQSKSG